MNKFLPGVWISDRLPALPDDAHASIGESPTGFRLELVEYLISVDVSSDLLTWLQRIVATDFSSINVFLITSVPGKYRRNRRTELHPHGHYQVADLLSNFALPVPDTVPIVAQTSRIGTFSKGRRAWLAEFASSLRCTKEARPEHSVPDVPSIRVIYPTITNVRGGHDGLLGGAGLTYTNDVHYRQQWLKKYMYQWKADQRHRTRAIPHMNSYARWKDHRLYWFILTSANLSKAGWGVSADTFTDKKLTISNYEAGILFLPWFVTNTTYFSMDTTDKITPPFPLPFDRDMVEYDHGDHPFVADVLFYNDQYFEIMLSRGRPRVQWWLDQDVDSDEDFDEDFLRALLRH